MGRGEVAGGGGGARECGRGGVGVEGSERRVREKWGGGRWQVRERESWREGCGGRKGPSRRKTANKRVWCSQTESCRKLCRG